MDGTGPRGQGPLTGRGLGKCQGQTKTETSGIGRRNGLRSRRGTNFGRPVATKN